MKKKWMIAVLLIALALLLDVTWNKGSFCIGDNLFSALGLPAWSNGTTGTHYLAVMGSIITLMGIALLNSTLQTKVRRWMWLIVVLFLIMFNLLVSLL